MVVVTCRWLAKRQAPVRGAVASEEQVTLFGFIEMPLHIDDTRAKEEAREVPEKGSQGREQGRKRRR